MPVREYRSTDGGAPQLSATLGQLITVLDAILVSGYGSVTAAGWSKSFSGSNKAVYRPGAGAARRYLDVNDNGEGLSGNGQDARVRGYEAMTAVSVGTDPFPQVAQSTYGHFIRKSTTNDVTTRGWLAWADDRTLIFVSQPAGLNEGKAMFYFGEFKSTVLDDPYNCIIGGRPDERSFAFDSILSFSGDTGYIARDHARIVKSFSPGKSREVHIANGGEVGNGALAWLNGPDGRLYISKITLHETDETFRGFLRGLWWVCHANSKAIVTDFDTFDGAGDLAGRSFILLERATGADIGVYCIETTDTWETNI